MNTITIELCAEDRARLDKIIEALENRPNCEGCVASALEYTQRLKAESDPAPAPLDEAQQKLAEIVAKAATEPQEAEADTNTQPEPEQPKEAAKTEPQAEEQPTVTLEQIQQKVVQLAASNDGAKKPRVRAIISNYGTKVSDLKDQPEKWGEVWAQLTALEQEA